MPGPYLSPGVYVEEIPSGVRPITGASTSDTAFVDYFARGPVDRAVRITSWGDFEREFGGLNTCSEASYAIAQYYLNGGKIAWVVRVAAGATTASRVLTGVQRNSTLPAPPEPSAKEEEVAGKGEGSKTSKPSPPILTVSAISPGSWGNKLQIAIDYHGVPEGTTAFNLVVRETSQVGGQVVASEVHRNLSADPNSSQYVETVVGRNSRLIRVEHNFAGVVPSATAKDAAGDPKSALWLLLGDSRYFDESKPEDAGLKEAPAEWENPSVTEGKDGTLPGSDTWKKSAGEAALLGTGGGETTSGARGMYALKNIAPHVFSLLCLPAAAELSQASAKKVWAAAATFCEAERAFLLADIGEEISTPEQMTSWKTNVSPQSDHAAVYFPRLLVPDPLRANAPRSVGPSGTIAGVIARTDAERGVWKAPAGTEASLRNASLSVQLTDEETGALNPFGINVLRTFPVYGNVVWGARTLRGADMQTSEWKYIPVRRTALYIEEALTQGLKWVVFQPNDEALWAQIRMNVSSFMQGLFRQGAFAGTTPREAYVVKCDSETTPPDQVDAGIVNIEVGFAPLKPAEFVVIKLQQLAGQVGLS